MKKPLKRSVSAALASVLVCFLPAQMVGQNTTKDGFQRAGMNWVTRDIAWLVSWQYRHLSRIPLGYDVMFLVIEKSPARGRDYERFDSYLILKPSPDLAKRVKTFLIMHVTDAEDGVVTKKADVDAELVRPVLLEAWLWVGSAGNDTQNENIQTDENTDVYILAGEPLDNDRVGGLQMIEAINPPTEGQLKKLIGRITEMLKGGAK